MTGLIRYGSNARENSILRSALATVAGYQCYSCREPKAFVDLEIDHLIPRSSPDALVRAESIILSPPDGFHVDDPENLAAICGSCNVTKSQKNLRSKLLFQIQQDTAVRRADEVRRLVSSIGSGHRIASYLMRAAQADLTDPSTRRAFVDFAPAIVQQLAAVDERHVDFVTVQHIRRQDIGRDFDLQLSLDGKGRFARDLLATALDRDLMDLVQSVGDEIVDELKELVRLKLSYGPKDGYSLASDPGSADVHHLELSFDAVEVTRRNGALHYELSGCLESWMTSFVTGELEDRQADIWIFGPFRALGTFAANPSDASLLDEELSISEIDLDIDW